MSTTDEQPRVADTRHEGYAVAWLTVGLVFGILGGVIGVYLVLRSTRWSPRWKVAVLALPLTLILVAKTFPESVPDGARLAALLATIALAIWAVRVLERAAQQGSGQRRASRVSALVIAVLAVAIVLNLAGRLHPIGSYDYHDDVVAAAHEADAAGEPYGVLTEGSALLNGGDENTVEKVRRLAGPGNARFAEIFDQVRDEDPDGEPQRSADGACFVFPVVTSREKGIDSVVALHKMCTGPSEFGSYRRLSNR